jgi:predicted PhzF superfamily epimerase YddE/YHI9
MPPVYKVRVLCDDSGRFGEPHALIIDEDKAISPAKRQAIATQLHLDETIFINDLASGDISIFDTQKEIPFAGTATLAAAKLISNLNDRPLDSLVCQGKSIRVWQKDDLQWVAASLDIMPGWNHIQYESAEAIDRIDSEEAKALQHTMVWAWIDKSEGRIRARTLASDWDIPEIEANGSGSMMLAAALQQPLRIEHGKGSIIFAEPLPNNQAALGGRVVDDTEIVEEQAA